MNTTLPVLPRHRSIVAVDIEGSTARTNPARAQFRSALYDLLEAALHASGISEQHRDPLIDRGDGALVLIHPVDQAPKTVLLTTFVPTLSDLLAEHATQHPGERFRLRVAVHAGEVHYDSRGCYGEDLDLTFRLLNAPELKKKLRQSDAPLALVVSQDIHRSLIRHGYDGIDDSAFEPLVRVRMAGQRFRGWVHVPVPKGLAAA
jgi:class 3 adenylate cyclase